MAAPRRPLRETRGPKLGLDSGARLRLPAFAAPPPRDPPPPAAAEELADAPEAGVVVVARRPSPRRGARMDEPGSPDPERGRAVPRGVRGAPEVVATVRAAPRPNCSATKSFIDLPLSISNVPPTTPGSAMAASNAAQAFGVRTLPQAELMASAITKGSGKRHRERERETT